MAIMLGANKLLAMAKDIDGLRHIAIGEVFFQLICRSIVLQLWGLFQEHLSPINLEYRPLEVVRPSFLAFEPSSTYTLIGPWCKSMLKNIFTNVSQVTTFKELCDVKGPLVNIAFLPSYLMLLILFFITSMGSMWRGHLYWVIFRHEARWPPRKSFICFCPLSNCPRDHHANH
jgi:hypothetical protein